MFTIYQHSLRFLKNYMVHPWIAFLGVYWGRPVILSSIDKVVLHSHGICFRWATWTVLVLKYKMIRLLGICTPPLTLIGWGLSCSIVCSRGVNILQASASSSLLTKCIWEPTKTSKIRRSYASGRRASRYLEYSYLHGFFAILCCLPAFVGQIQLCLLKVEWHARCLGHDLIIL